MLHVPEFLSTLWFYWIVAGVVGLIGVWLLWRGLWRDRSRGRPRCPKCWYRLDGITDGITDGNTAGITDAKQINSAAFKPVTCSECGKKVVRHRKLFKTRRHWISITLGAVLLLTCWYGTFVRDRMIKLDEPFEQAIVPTSVWMLALSRSEWPLDTEETLSRVHARTAYVLPQFDPNGTPLESITWWQRELLITSLARLAYQSDNDGHKQWAINWLGDLAVHSDTAITKLHELAKDGDVTTRTRVFAAACNAKERALPLLAMAMESALQDPREPYAPMLLAAIGPRQFEGMTDETLCDMAFSLAMPGSFWGSTREPARDLYLLEMIGRQTPFIKTFLESKATTPHWFTHNDPPDNKTAKPTQLQIELLAALRRIQGKPDPIQIGLTAKSLRGTASKLPSVSATLRSIETLEHPLAYQQGGDNRGERPGRWRFHVVDQNGNVAPVRPVKYSMGGRSGFGNLKASETSHPTSLDMNAFMDPLPPGRYTVTVQYHNGQYISDLQDVTHLIVLTSDPIELIIAED